MTYEEWIEEVVKVLEGYNEGRFLSSEVFNTVLSKASEVEVGSSDANEQSGEVSEDSTR